ncbi:MAG TPA: hypothetical protein VGD67_24625, partial [Pseudonocardiaceae bacterium]
MRRLLLTAPLAALVSPLTMLVAVVAGAVVAFVAAGTVFHVSASGSAATGYVLDNRCADDTGLVADAHYYADRPAVPLGPSLPAIREAAAAQGLDVVRRTRYAEPPVTVRGEPVAARLVARDGATDHLRPIAGGSGPGAWVPPELGLTPGDSITVAGAVVPVAAVYPALTDPLDDYWCAERSQLVPNTLADTAPAALIVVPDAVLDAITPLTGETVRITAGRPARTSAEAAAHAARVADVAGRVRGIVGQPLRIDDHAALLGRTGPQAHRAVTESLLPLSGVSLLIGLGAVVGLARQWVLRRHAEVRLLWTRGVPPAAIGGKAVLELGGPLLVGAALGWLVAWLGVPVLAPSTYLDAWAPVYAGYATGLAWLACAAVLAVATTLRVRRRFQAAAAGPGRWRRALRWLPWELGAAALAVVSWQRLSDGALVVSRSELLPRVDVLALMFPLFCLAVITGVGTRLAGLALRLGHRSRGWRWPAVVWAARRAAAQHRLTVALLAVAGLAVGVVAVGVGISGTERQAVLDKGRLFVGSDTAVRLLSSTPPADGRSAVPESLRGRATEVGVRDLDLTGRAGKVLAVDPATIADGMPWRPEWGGGARLDELMSLLGPAGPDGAVPVIAFGTIDPQRLVPDGIESVRVVGTVRTFPGREHAESMLIMSWEGLATADRRGFTRYVMSFEDAATVARELEAAGQHTGWAFTARGANDALPFLVVAWTFDFFVTLGAVLAAVAVAALLVAVEARRRATAVAHALLARMGLRARDLYGSYLAELAGLALLAAALGLAGGRFVLATASTRLDPAPWLSPTPVPAGMG